MSNTGRLLLLAKLIELGVAPLWGCAHFAPFRFNEET